MDLRKIAETVGMWDGRMALRKGLMAQMMVGQKVVEMVDEMADG